MAESASESEAVRGGVPHAERHDLSDVPWWRSFVVRVVGAYTVVMVGCVAAAIWHQSVQAREGIVLRFGSTLKAIAATTAPHLDGDDVVQIRASADVARPAFVRLRATLERAQQANGLREDQIYVLRAQDASYTQMTFVAMLQRATFVGDAYAPPPEVVEAYRAVAATGEAQQTRLYTDAHGTFISGLAPVRDRSGAVVGVVQVDYGLAGYMAEAEAATLRLVLLGLILLAVALVVGAVMHRLMQRKVVALLTATEAIHHERYDYSIKAPGDDEIGLVAQELNHVLERLRERFDMLKFLPPHTARMIAEAAAEGGVRLDLGRSVDVVVLESDIRGFSALSEAMAPGDVIAMLNDYIRVQAEQITAEGGSIDKYMGDAVLAVFEGPQKEARALRAALGLQRAVAEMNAQGVFASPVRVGVGLSRGEVVMGNMGSEHRMEHTVIGAVVNLAARLCSAAGGGEVVCHAELIAQIEPEARDAAWALGEVERLKVKGFEEEVACYRLSASHSGAGLAGEGAAQ